MPGGRPWWIMLETSPIIYFLKMSP